MAWGTFIGLLHYTIALAVAVRVLLKPRMAASVRLAWILVIELIPFLGIGAWVLFGEVRMRRADRQRAAHVRGAIAAGWQASPDVVQDIGEPAAPVVAQARTTGGMEVVRGNRLRLLPEGDEALEEVARAIDDAKTSVMVMFYIWLDDASGRRVAAACAAAAARGVAVRVIVDALGSRRFLWSKTWRELEAAGVIGVEAFPLGNPLTRVFVRRLDLRNHRKIVVIDHLIAYTGSRNCADMAFAVKPRYAPWVDVLMAVEGPAVRQLQAVFVQDWMSATDHPLTDPHAGGGYAYLGTEEAGGETALVLPPVPAVEEPGQVVQVVPTGPDFRPGTLSDVLATLIHAARDRLVITTPYYVPDEATDAAIRAAARRGVRVTLILPERNDSRLVDAVSAGFHADLLRAGVEIALFQGGLIHSKIVTVDGRMAMAGSANLDRRSFDLNYEVSLLIVDEAATAALDARQQSYLDRARMLTLAEVLARPPLKRMAGNLAALAAPLL